MAYILTQRRGIRRRNKWNTMYHAYRYVNGNYYQHYSEKEVENKEDESYLA